MDRELLENYFRKSQFSDVQAEALSRILAEMKETFATKEDLSVLKAELQGEMKALKAELKGEMATLRSELKSEMAALRFDLQGQMAAGQGEVRADLTALEARLTWRMIAVVSIVVGVFGTVFTLLNAFVV